MGISNSNVSIINSNSEKEITIDVPQKNYECRELKKTPPSFGLNNYSTIH